MTAPAVIAIVDDDTSVRQALGRLLRSFDLNVRLYSGAQELLDASGLQDISCVVTDIRMPGMTGFELCSALRARDYAMPVIFMTAFVQEGYEANVRAAGAPCFLQKPFTDTDLMACINQVIGPDAATSPGSETKKV